jgi:hypothetical protein
MKGRTRNNRIGGSAGTFINWLAKQNILYNIVLAVSHVTDKSNFFCALQEEKSKKLKYYILARKSMKIVTF